LQGAYLEEMLAYWKQRWSEFSLFDVQDLPFAKPLPQPARFIIETISHTLNRPLSNALRPLLGEKKITLHMLGLAALNILLYLYSQKERIGVWGIFANRIRPETENIMGWLANGYVMGVRLAPEDEFDSVLAEVRDVILEAQSRQEIPAALLWSHFMKDLDRNPGSGRSPIQPHISFVTETRADLQPDAFIQETELPYKTGGLALRFVVIDDLQDIRLVTHYSIDRFDRETVDRMLADWRQIVGKIVKTPSAKVSDFAAMLSLTRQDAALPADPQ
jgi:non-ribosomal peptide synthetase component F